MYVLDKEVECFHCQGCLLYILRNGRGYKENVSSPKNVFVTKESIVDRKWYPLMVWWYTKQTIKNMKIYTWQLLIHAFDGHWYQFERFSLWNITRHLLCEIYIISPGIKRESHLDQFLQFCQENPIFYFWLIYVFVCWLFSGRPDVHYTGGPCFHFHFVCFLVGALCSETSPNTTPVGNGEREVNSSLLLLFLFLFLTLFFFWFSW